MRARLLKVGWDTPTTREVVAWRDDIAASPFDGITLFVETRNGAGAVTGKLSIDGWAKKVFGNEIDPAVADLAAARLPQAPHSLVRFNCGPGDIDWFEPFDSVLNNLMLAARVAKLAGMAGIWLDTETYVNRIFDLSTRPLKAAQGWVGYRDQVRLRGAEIMTRLNETYAGLTVKLALGNSWVWAFRGATTVWGDYTYDLLVPFVDGLLDGGAQPGQIVDGNERTYGWKSPSDMCRAAENARGPAALLSADPDRYRAHVTIGLSLWLDYNQPTAGWNLANTEANYFSPAVFETALRASLFAADDWVWIYTHRPRWWGPNGPDDLPTGYDVAIRQAQAGAEIR